MSKRIWELDALRGLMVLIMIAFHLAYDLVYLFGLVELSTPGSVAVFNFCSNWAGAPFLFISGICVTFSSRPVRRGLTVIGCGMVITAVTAGMYLLQFADRGIIIYFGVLQCLGSCMLLWPLFKKLPTPILGVLGVILAAAGLYLKWNVRVDFPWLIPFGLFPSTFSSSDYFPLMPNFGYFLIGAVLGRVCYPQRESLFPKRAPLPAPNRPASMFLRQTLSAHLYAPSARSGRPGRRMGTAVFLNWRSFHE